MSDLSLEKGSKGPCSKHSKNDCFTAVLNFLFRECQIGPGKKDTKDHVVNIPKIIVLNFLFR